ncbi:hypothetical protein [Treponema sp. C6A8]|uniref:hypothetical protein n=1 Tax=Treponema sp. C6A8 TaxID=1410609 RepID=UPI0004862ED2|nr:hypothetical protein [Treponema sp. C6A8]
MKNDFIFQTKFSDNAEKVIKQYYQLPSDDKILLAIWAGRACSVPVRERGFLFTKQGFAWNFSTIEVSGNDGENIERSQCNCNFLSKANTDFKLAFAKTDGIANELHLKTGLTEYIFLFPTDFPKEEIAELEKIVRDYFTGYFNEQNFVTRANEHKLILKLLNIPDFFSILTDNFEISLKNFSNKITKFFTSSKKGNKSEKAEYEKKSETSNLKEKKKNILLSFICNAIDLCADLSLLTAIVILLKISIPAFNQELNKNLNSIYALIEAIFKLSFFDYFFAFFMLKLCIIFSKKDVQKSVSLLLLIITSIVIPLIEFSKTLSSQTYKIIFIGSLLIIALLLLLTLQFSLGFKRKTIKKKCLIFFLGTIFIIPFVLNSQVRNNFGEIFNSLWKWINSIFTFWQNNLPNLPV